MSATNWDFKELPRNLDYIVPPRNCDFEKKVPPKYSDFQKKVTPRNWDFGRKFQKFESKSDFFPIGKIGIQNFPKIFLFSLLELHLRKF